MSWKDIIMGKFNELETRVRELALAIREEAGVCLPSAPCLLRINLGNTIVWFAVNDRREHVIEVTTRRRRWHICDYNFITDEVEIVENYEPTVINRLEKALARLRKELE